MAHDDVSKLAAVDKRVASGVDELWERRLDEVLTRGFDKIMNALQELIKNAEVGKDNGSNEQKDGFKIVCATNETQEQNQELKKIHVLEFTKAKDISGDGSNSIIKRVVEEKPEYVVMFEKSEGKPDQGVEGNSDAFASLFRTEASTRKSNKPKVKTEPCRAQIWSKQNIALALKMRGITVKWKKSRARTDPRIIVKEGIQVNPIRETSNRAIPLPRREAGRNKKRKQHVRHRSGTRRAMCRPPPKPPDRNVWGGGNKEVLTTKRKRGSCVWVARPPPKPPDGDNSRRNSRTTSSGKNCKRKGISTSPTQGATMGCEEPIEVKAKNWSHGQPFETTRQHLTREEPRDYKTQHWNSSREPTLRTRLFFKGAVLLDLGLVGDSK